MIKKTGVLLINLGTPTQASWTAVACYLWEFLTDSRVIRLPFGLRHLLVVLIVLFRARRSTHAYQSIWTAQGSPLRVYSEELATKLQTALGESYHVVLGMRYGKPSIRYALSQLKDCHHLIVFPMYPQYAESSTGTALVAVFKALSRFRVIPSVDVRDVFYEKPGFIGAWANQIRKHRQDNAFIIFSYHGLPQRVATVGSYSYAEQCMKTSDHIAQALDLETNRYQTSFQSRLGKEAWVQPYTNEVIRELYEKGERHLCVVCPSFMVDCLETLEEIGVELKENWFALGGETFTLVPCLNVEQETIDFLKGEFI